MLSPAIISVTNKMHINDISNSIMLGIQHNLRHFQGEVSFTKNNTHIMYYDIKIHFV